MTNPDNPLIDAARGRDEQQEAMRNSLGANPHRSVEAYHDRVIQCLAEIGKQSK